MQLLFKTSFCLLLFMGLSQNIFAQKACCAKGNKVTAKCAPTGNTSDKETAKVCCSSTLKETTSGCTPSNCRGAKTKFGEAKIISDLRLELVTLKSKMETHERYSFSDASISVHDIIGETDDQSLEIIKNHITLIESEFSTQTNYTQLPMTHSHSKAALVRELGNRISVLSNSL